MKKDYHETRQRVDGGHILSIQGLDGIDYYTAGVLYTAIEQTVKQALADLPNASPEEIANAVMNGVRFFVKNLQRESVESYARQFKPSE